MISGLESELEQQAGFDAGCDAYVVKPFYDLTLVRGVLGSYPEAYLSLTENEIPNLVKTLQNLNTEEDYIALLDKFAVRRSSPKFWSFSDRVHRWYQKDQPIEFGLLDYNRFENR